MTFMGRSLSRARKRIAADLLNRFRRSATTRTLPVSRGQIVGAIASVDARLNSWPCRDHLPANRLSLTQLLHDFKTYSLEITLSILPDSILLPHQPDSVNVSIKKANNWTFSCVYISEKVVSCSIQLSVTE
jgi:hypothetical protein